MPNTHQAMYTPGPWKLGKYTFSPDGVSLNGEVNRVFMPGATSAVVYSMGADEPIVTATARLIAAAPELLEACEVAFAELENHKGVPGVLEHILPCIRAAIARATGGAV